MKFCLSILTALIFNILCINGQTIHSFAGQSQLRSGKFVKIRVHESGIYKLTYDDLKSMGLKPAEVSIFGYGGNVLEQNFMLPKIDDLPELPVYMEKGADGVFNAGDYILFYANGINKWKYNTDSQLFTHQRNPYSEYGYYFASSDAGTKQKIQTVNLPAMPSGAVIRDITEFTDYQVYEKELQSVAKSGKIFYGEKFDVQTSLDIPFSSPNTVVSIPLTAVLDVASSSKNQTFFKLSLPDGQSNSLGVRALSGSNYELATSAKGQFQYLPTGDNLTFTLDYIKAGTSPKGYLNYLAINIRRQLVMSEGAMPFRNTDNLGKNVYNRYLLGNASAAVQIWDVSDAQNITRIATETIDGKISFTASAAELKQYLAVNPSGSFLKPEIVGEIPNQNLHALPSVDFVIITHPDYRTQAELLAQTHREVDNMSVAVVTADEVYNEFSSGAPDATAYRWFMKMFYERADAGSKPKYLLLFGKGSFDNRQLVSDSGASKILTYQSDNSLVTTSSFVTDDYFALLNDNEGPENGNGLNGLVDLGVGRFSVSTVAQADIVVNKTISYIKNTQKGIWKNQICFVADDGDNVLHIKQANSIAEIIDRKFPAYQVNKIYLDAYRQEIKASGASYPQAHSALLDQLHKGLFFIDYTGHAGTTGWADEQVITRSDIMNLSNRQLPLWVAVTCDFLMFDRSEISAGEAVLLNPNGGGIGVIAATRPVYSSQNAVFNGLVCENLLKKENGKHYRLGDLQRIAKNSIGNEINKLCYALMGDPALMLNYPDLYSVRTDSVNEELISGNDTLKALSVVKLSGIIMDEAGKKVENFNGTVRAVVYDKAQSLTTLDNEHEGATLTFNAWSNILFSGKTSVKNGDYALTFMMPKDIKYNYGSGRINFYAADSIFDSEAQGEFHNFIIGGINPNVSYENDGPGIDLALNSAHFYQGNRVNETPVLLAQLNDINGINIAGNGIGHDLLLVIDNDPYQTIVLNDYYEAKANSYTEGLVRYKLPQLADGKHTLSLRAWDLLNNSSTKTVEFEVVKGLAPEIFTLYNYPNPVRGGSTRIVVNHDRPETVLNTLIDVFDLSGRLVWSFSQPNADDIVWDLAGSDGVRVKGGLYIYRVTVQSNNSEAVSKSNKLLVVE
jgi:hypothetical protein